jgi:hypothetical protein
MDTEWAIAFLRREHLMISKAIPAGRIRVNRPVDQAEARPAIAGGETRTNRFGRQQSLTAHIENVPTPVGREAHGRRQFSF